MHPIDDPAASDRPLSLENLGLRLLSEGRAEEAARAFSERLRIGPVNLRSIRGLGLAAVQLNDYVALSRAADLSLAFDPSVADGWFFRGVALAHQSGTEEAIRCLREAIRLAPSFARAHFQLGLALQRTSAVQEALQSLDRAIELQPNHIRARISRAILLGDLSRLDDAMVAIDAVLRRQPGNALARYVKGELLLLQGDYAQGWALIGDMYAMSKADVGQTPLWKGEPLQSRRLLLHSELGLGDYLMYARFVPLLQAQGATVILRAPAALADLLRASFPAALVTTAPASDERPDYHHPLMSLPAAMQPGKNSVPSDFPYLRVPDAARTRWQGKLGNKTAFRVGVTWSGNPSRRIDRSILKQRSMPFDAIRPLFDVPVEWHLLQKDILDGDAEPVKLCPQLTIHTHELDDFSDTAALAAEMDLVISTDTSVAHLAGGLGRPLWMMLPVSSDFRWPVDTPSPWYPGAWIARQQTPGDWAGVVARVAERLRGMAG